MERDLRVSCAASLFGWGDSNVPLLSFFDDETEIRTRIDSS